jgi:hypothetical protein
MIIPQKFLDKTLLRVILQVQLRGVPHQMKEIWAAQMVLTADVQGCVCVCVCVCVFVHAHVCVCNLKCIEKIWKTISQEIVVTSEMESGIGGSQ